MKGMRTIRKQRITSKSERSGSASNDGFEEELLTVESEADESLVDNPFSLGNSPGEVVEETRSSFTASSSSSSSSSAQSSSMVSSSSLDPAADISPLSRGAELLDESGMKACVEESGKGTKAKKGSLARGVPVAASRRSIEKLKRRVDIERRRYERRRSTSHLSEKIVFEEAEEDDDDDVVLLPLVCEEMEMEVMEMEVFGIERRLLRKRRRYDSVDPSSFGCLPEGGKKAIKNAGSLEQQNPRSCVTTPLPASKFGSARREEDCNNDLSSSSQPSADVSFFSRIPAPCRSTVLSYLGMDVLAFDNAMTNHVERKNLMKAYRGTIIRGFEFDYPLTKKGATKKWFCDPQAKYKDDVCKPLDRCLNVWAKKRGVLVRDFFLNIPDSPSENLLSILMSCMRYAMIKLILQHCDTLYRFEPGTIGRSSTGLLSMLIYHGDAELVKLICEKSEINVNGRDERGSCALHVVCSTLHDPEMAKALLEAGAITEFVDERDGETPIFAASTSGNIDMIKVLHEHGANLNALNKYNHTPIDRACREVKKNFTLSSRDYLKSINAKSGRQVMRARRRALLAQANIQLSSQTGSQTGSQNSQTA